MIKIILSEREFDYELQALAVSFFSGQQVKVEVDERLGLQSLKSFLDDYVAYSSASVMNEEVIDIIICMVFGEKNISALVRSYEISEASKKILYEISDKAFVTGDKNWHKLEGKVFNPYRTYYKNIVKRLMFNMLVKLREEAAKCDMLNDRKLLCKINMRTPVWGTMTGVRPTKIVMNEMMSGGDKSHVKSVLKEVYCCSKDKAELAYNIAEHELDLLKKADYKNGYSLYIGIPFCPTTCLYCSFTSYPYDKFGHLADNYIEALIKELKFLSDISVGKKLTSVYIGGGTPTALTDRQLYRLLSFISDNFLLDSCYEFTVEAGRPDSITDSKLKVLKDFGVKRISVNPQTMKQSTLELIGRKHTVRQTIEAFNMARENGFDNINMDLIIGLPEEIPEDFCNTLSQIESLNPDSLTIHSLVVKRASRLSIALDDCRTDTVCAESITGSMCIEKMLDIGQEFAYSHGYKPYYMYRQKNKAGYFGSSGQENIGYAREGKECLYNILIMEEKQTILAAGAGASTKLYHKELGQVSRIENVKNVSDYIVRVDEMIARKQKGMEACYYGGLY